MIKYYDRRSIIHLLDPRTKIIWSLVISILVVITNNWLFLIFLFLTTLIPWVIVRPPVRKLRLLLFIMITIVFGTILSQAIFYHRMQKTPIFTIIPCNFPIIGKITGGINIYYEGIIHGAIQSLRLLSVVTISSLIIITTYPSDLILALTKFRLPQRFAFMLTVALRFLPDLLGEAKRILLAQQLRGLKLRGTIGRLKGFQYILVPLVINSLRTARQLALACETKAFSEKRNSLRQLKFSYIDYILWVILAGFVVLESLICV